MAARPKAEALDHRMAFDSVANFFEEVAKGGLLQYRPYSEREYLEEALKFANGDPTASLGALMSGSAAPANDLREDSEFRDVIGPDEKITHAQLLDRIAPTLRGSFAEICGAVVEGKTPVLAFMGDPSDRMLSLYRFELVENGRGFEVKERFLPADLQTAFVFSAALLVSVNKPYGKELCRCQLPTCGRFFFLRQDARGGQPARKYCCAEHMNELHRLQTAERVRRHREKVKRAKKSRAHK